MRSFLLLIFFLTFFSAVSPDPLKGKDLLIQLAVNAFGPTKILGTDCMKKKGLSSKNYCNLHWDLFMTADDVIQANKALKGMFEDVGSVSRTIVYKKEKIPKQMMMSVESSKKTISKDAHVWSVEYGPGCENKITLKTKRDCRIIRVKNVALYQGAEPSEGNVTVGQPFTGVPKASEIFIDAMVGPKKEVFFLSTKNKGTYSIDAPYGFPTKKSFDPKDAKASWAPEKKT